MEGQIPEPPPACDGTGSITVFFSKLRTGDETAARELFQRYFPRIRGLARKTLVSYPQRVADSDDAAQSAFFSFYQRAERGDFGDELDRHSLWNLLGVITMGREVHEEQAANSPL